MGVGDQTICDSSLFEVEFKTSCSMKVTGWISCQLVPEPNCILQFCVMMSFWFMLVFSIAVRTDALSTVPALSIAAFAI
jgi:hypothetical protein